VPSVALATLREDGEMNLPTGGDGNTRAITCPECFAHAADPSVVGAIKDLASDLDLPLMGVTAVFLASYHQGGHEKILTGP
jgi:hypothetical protein